MSITITPEEQAALEAIFPSPKVVDADAVLPEIIDACRGTALAGHEVAIIEYLRSAPTIYQREMFAIHATNETLKDLQRDLRAVEGLQTAGMVKLSWKPYKGSQKAAKRQSVEVDNASTIQAILEALGQNIKTLLDYLAGISDYCSDDSAPEYHRPMQEARGTILRQKFHGLEAVLGFQRLPRILYADLRRLKKAVDKAIIYEGGMQKDFVKIVFRDYIYKYFKPFPRGTKERIDAAIYDCLKAAGYWVTYAGTIPAKSRVIRKGKIY